MVPSVIVSAVPILSSETVTHSFVINVIAILGALDNVTPLKESTFFGTSLLCQYNSFCYRAVSPKGMITGTSFLTFTSH